MRIGASRLMLYWFLYLDTRSTGTWKAMPKALAASIAAVEEQGVVQPETSVPVLFPQNSTMVPH